MEERRDWGCLNCKRNSIDFAFIKTWYLSYLFDFSFNKNNWKLVLIRSQLHEQLWKRPKQHFSQNCKLYTFQRMTTTVLFKKQTFRATRSGAQNCAPQNEKKHLRTTVYNKEEVGEILVFHFPNPRVGVRQLSKTPTCTAHQTIVNPKFSAQSEPMVKSYDQNKFQAFSLKENDKKKKSFVCRFAALKGPQSLRSSIRWIIKSLRYSTPRVIWNKFK